MSTFTQCDRCGKIYKEKYSNIKIVEERTSGTLLNRYDLCPGCVDRFHEFLGDKQETKEKGNEVYAVSSGEYSDYSIMKVFSSLEAAERYIVQYNKSRPKSYDKAFLEVMNLDDVEDIESFEIYRYIKFNFYGQTKNYWWSMEFTDQPIGDLQITDSLEKPGFFYGKIPVTRTYDDRNEKDCRLVEKIIQDNIAKYKAEQAGL